MKNAFFLFGGWLLLLSCNQSPSPKKVQDKQKPVLKELLVKGTDTGMIQLTGPRRKNPVELICQTWRVLKPGEAVPEHWSSVGKDGIVFFADSTLVINPGNQPSIGRWKVTMENNFPAFLTLELDQQRYQEFRIETLSATSLVLSLKNQYNQKITLYFGGEGLSHKNPHNDPFYPDHVKWMIKPLKKESPEQIRQRVKECVYFYALYFRDNIKRNRETISFEGLPDAFDWYEGGMGLPDRDLVSNAWINCFYNEEQSLQGWEVLHQLMKDFDFEWPDNAPNWVWRTQPVLEQMVLKLK